MYIIIRKNPKKLNNTSFRYTQKTKTAIDWLLAYYKSTHNIDLTVSDLIESLIQAKHDELSGNGHVLD